MKSLVLTAPISGWFVPLSEVPDPAFSERMVGEGAAIDPLGSCLHAPCDGEITSIANAKHAVTMRADNGAEILLHVGLDTVAAAGAGLAARVEPGQRVRCGDPLLDVALDTLLNHAKSLITPVVVVNAQEFRVVQRCAGGMLERGAAFIELTPSAATSRHSGVSAGDYRDVVEEVVEEVTIALPHGIHARPAARIVGLSRQYSSRLRLSLRDRDADAASMTALLSLAAGFGDRVRVHGSGSEDAREAVRSVTGILTASEGEPVDAPRAALASEAGDGRPSVPDSASDNGVFYGSSASRGIALGPAQHFRRGRIHVREQGDGADREREKLRLALDRAASRLRGGERNGGSAILAAQAELLADPALLADAKARIDDGKSAGFAWQEALSRAREALAASGDSRIAGRVADLNDVEGQVLRELGATLPDDEFTLAEGAILLTDELLPSQLNAPSLSRMAGFCSAGGGPTSHVALMAAARGIPAIVGAGSGIERIADGTRILLDADRGALFVAPDDAAVARAEQAIRARGKARAESLRHAARDAFTADGIRIEVFANLASETEASAARELGAEGCGLLRTELMYLDRREAPSVGEQSALYEAIAAALDGRPLVIRTLDVGGDKPLPYLPLPAEENPLLGMRGLRVSLRYPQILRDQLTAILGVERLSQCRILLPMVTEPGEVRTVRAMLDELVAARRPGTTIALGAMIETPASAAMAGVIAREADFLSIGTNDLAQYTLAIDRTHPELAGRVDCLHPAVLQQVSSVCRAAGAAGRNVSVCGALASDAVAVPVLLGLGVRTLSVVPDAIPDLKAQIRRLTIDECARLASAALAMDDARSVRDRAESFHEQLIAGTDS